jgi:hypothetical protein
VTSIGKEVIVDPTGSDEGLTAEMLGKTSTIRETRTRLGNYRLFRTVAVLFLDDAAPHDSAQGLTNPLPIHVEIRKLSLTLRIRIRPNVRDAQQGERRRLSRSF